MTGKNNKLIVLILACLCLSLNARSQKDTSKSELRLDFGLSRDRAKNFWPIFKKSSTKDNYDLEILAPFFRYDHDIKGHEKYSHLFPFWWYDSSVTGRDFRLFSLYYPSLFRFSSNPSEGTHTFKFLELAPYINFFEMTRSADGIVVNNNLLFFILFNRDDNRHSSYFICFPVYWQFKNPEHSSSLFIPFYAKGANYREGKHYLIATPLFYHFKDSSGTRNVFFPLWWNNNEIYYRFSNGKLIPTDTSRTNVIFPFYWSYRSKKKSNTVLFPLIWSHRDSIHKSFTFFPLFSAGHSTKDKSSHLEITPLYWHFKDSTGHSTLLLPFLWNSEYINSWWVGNKMCPDTIRTRIVFPFYFYFKSNYVTNKYIFPLIWSHKDSIGKLFTAFPFYSTYKTWDGKTKYLSIALLFRHSKEPGAITNFLFPIWGNWIGISPKDTSYTNFILPLYFSYRLKDVNNKVIFPFIWNFRNKHYHTFAFEPLFSVTHFKDNPATRVGITPFFWHYNYALGSRNTFFPLWWQRKTFLKDDTIRHNIIFPIYWSYHSKQKDSKVLFPLLWIFKSPTHSSLTFVPLFSEGHSKLRKSSYLVITPLFWHFKDSTGHSNCFFPLWWNREHTVTKWQNGKYFHDTIRSNVFFPLVWSHKSTYKKNLVIFPLLWSHRDSLHSSLTFIPLFSAGHSAKQKKSYLVITPLFWHFKDSLGSKNYLFPLLWSHRDNSGSGFTFFPLFSAGHSSKGKRSHLVVTPLFWHFKDSLGSRNYLAPFFWCDRHGKNANTILFPIIWGHKDSLYRSFTLFPLFSSGHSANGKESHLVVTPLFWHFKDTTGHKTLFFPIIWNKKEILYGMNGNKAFAADTEYTRVIFPFYWSKKSKAEDNTVIFPLLWSFNTAEYHTLTLFPLFSAGYTKDNRNSYKVITPFFWMRRTPNSLKTDLYPLFSYRKDSLNGSRLSILYFLFRYKKTKERKALSFLWPILELRSGEDLKYFRLTPFIWSKRTHNSGYFSIQPFYYHGWSDKETETRILWELFVHKNEPGKRTSNAILWKLVSSDKYTNGDHEFRILQYLFADVKKDSNSEHTFFPFYHYSLEHNGDKTFSTMFGIYHYMKRQVSNTNESYKEIRVFWFIRVLSNYRALKAKGIDIKQRKKAKHSTV